jgi:hypothetical protein
MAARGRFVQHFGLRVPDDDAPRRLRCTASARALPQRCTSNNSIVARVRAVS